MRGKSKKIDRNVIFLSLIFVIFIVTVIFISRQLRSDEFMLKMDKNEYITISFNVGEGNTLLFSKLLIICPDTYNAAIFNIPANHRTVIESSRLDRLDILFDFRRPEKMIQRIETIASMPVDFYINVKPDDIVKIVDLLFGLELFIANPFEIINDYEVILLPSGSNILDGEKVLVFLTAESSNENDADIIGRWHKFLQAFMKRTGDRSLHFDNRDIFNRFYSLFSTDMNKKSFRSFLSVIDRINTDRMILQRILGDRRTIDGNTLLFPYHDGNLLRETMKQTLLSIKSEDIVSEEEAIRVEILNGTSTPGLAARTAHFFTNLGFDVVAVRNAERNNHERTVVISRSRNPLAANQVANTIRCTNIELSPERHPAGVPVEDITPFSSAANQVDVTIILGRDFDGRHVVER